MTRRLRASLAATEGLEDGWLTEMIGANMAFRRRVLERVPRFDDELGPGALGYGDDSLFSWQLEQAGFAMGRAPEAVVEHHFEESRLLRRFLLESARRTGQSNAYLLHHWKHEKIRWPMVYLGMTYLKLARRRLISGKDMVDGEGCSEWEMSITTEQRRYRQYMIERRRLRNYERHGLIKLQESSTLEARSINTVAGQAVNPDTGARSQLLRFLGFLALLCIAFCRPLITLLEFCAGSELNSYILLVPFVSAYLLYLQRKSLKGGFGSSSGWAVLFAAIAIVAYWCSNKFVSQNDRISLQMLSFVCLMYCGGFLFLGRKWIAKAAFPVSFLAFLIPLPYQVVDRLETASKLASADCAAFFYWLFDIPVLRDTQDGTVFQLPNIALRVAQECSGIHSSLILVIASLIACHLLLKSFWRRAGLIVFAIALGVVRNGFRIATLGWLCVHIGPQMIDSPIHHRGGPIFFVLSLIPLLLLLWVLCKGDRKIFPANGSGLQRDPTIP
jgi:exosortase C (VPDSG-CTERM-specific)